MTPILKNILIGLAGGAGIAMLVYALCGGAAWVIMKWDRP